MRKHIMKIYYVQVILFIGIIMSVSILGLFFIERANIRKAVIADFEHALETAANNLFFNIRINEQNVTALSSRTMIRKELYKWYEGKIGLNDVREYTNPKYNEGASVYEDIRFAIRMDNKNNRIAEYRGELFNGNRLIEENLSIEEIDSIYYVIIRNDIIHNDIPIGTDTAAFRLTDFDEKEYLKLINPVILSDSEYKPDEKTYSNSNEIGKTGFYLAASMDHDIFTGEMRKNIRIILIHAAVLIIVVLLVSYLTILKLVNRLIEDLNSYNARIVQQERSSAIGQIASGIAHDFNNIMMIIIGYSELLKEDQKIPDTVKGSVDTIYSSGLRAASLVKKLLDYNRQSVFKYEVIDIVSFIKNIIKTENYNNHDFAVSVSSSVKARNIRIDNNLFRSVINNLVRNSREANSTSVEIMIFRDPDVQGKTCDICSSKIEGSWLCLSVKDNGDGINDDIDKKQIFEPFYSTKGTGYSGLGLSQVYGIVKQHSGHLIVEQNQGTGITFTIFLPENPSVI